MQIFGYFRPGVKEHYCPQNNTAGGQYYTGTKLPGGGGGAATTYINGKLDACFNSYEMLNNKTNYKICIYSHIWEDQRISKY